MSSVHGSTGSSSDCQANGRTSGIIDSTTDVSTPTLGLNTTVCLSRSTAAAATNTVQQSRMEVQYDADVGLRCAPNECIYDMQGVTKSTCQQRQDVWQREGPAQCGNSPCAEALCSLRLGCADGDLVRFAVGYWVAHLGPVAGATPSVCTGCPYCWCARATATGDEARACIVPWQERRTCNTVHWPDWGPA